VIQSYTEEESINGITRPHKSTKGEDIIIYIEKEKDDGIGC
jgi:hypothetical protein